MKRLLLCVAVLATHFPTFSDNPDKDFDSFMKSAMTDFDSFIDDANRDFLDFMRSPWKKFEAEKPKEQRPEPEPVQPVIVQPDDTVASKREPRQLTIEEILDLTSRENEQRPVVDVDVPQTVIGDKEMPPADVTPGSPVVDDKPAPAPSVCPVRDTVDRPAAPVPAPKPANPVKPVAPAKPARPDIKPAAPTAPKPVVQERPSAPRPVGPLYTGGEGRIPLSFAGVTYYVNAQLKNVISLRRLDENSVTDAYEALLRSDYKPLVADLTALRDKGLNGEWALFMFIKQLSESFVGQNESMVMRQFLLNRMGYRARVARNADTDRLTIFVAPDCQLYGVISITVDGVPYYDVDAKRPYYFFMCSKDAPGSNRKLNMRFAAAPYLDARKKTSTHTSPHSKASATVSVPVALMDFYKKIPQCDYSVYANSGVDKGVEAQLLGALRQAIAGKGEKEAALILLDYVQNGFEYATDDVQFGYEKPFFVEELFYYPKCDCEDRSVLYRYLVMRLLGLDTVLLEYPNHIATAVAFREPVEGDYVTVGGRRYTVCDPTFIGAGIGMTMPQFRTTKAKVLKI